MALSQTWTETGGRSAALAGDRYNVRIFAVSGGFNTIITIDGEPETSNHPGLLDAQEFSELMLRTRGLIGPLPEG